MNRKVNGSNGGKTMIEPDFAVDRVRKASRRGVRLSMMFTLGVLGLPLLDVSQSQGAEDIREYPELQKVLAERFGEGKAAIVMITLAKDEEETETLTLFDPDLAVLVPKGQMATAAHDGTLEIEVDVQSLTLGSPKCELVKLPDGDQIWVVRSDTCPPR